MTSEVLTMTGLKIIYPKKTKNKTKQNKVNSYISEKSLNNLWSPGGIYLKAVLTSCLY